jgi:hypothetical protein
MDEKQTTELRVDHHMTVGPQSDVYGHGPVTLIGEDKAADIYVCLDCGYTHKDIRMLAHEDCERKQNEVNTTWREALEDKDELPEASESDRYPLDG